jgi:hypothetical protein
MYALYTKSEGNSNKMFLTVLCILTMIHFIRSKCINVHIWHYVATKKVSDLGTFQISDFCTIYFAKMYVRQLERYRVSNKHSVEISSSV